MGVRNAYELLGIPETAEASQIRRAYRILALETHPDRCAHDPDAIERFLEIRAAYEILIDPRRRAAYDRDPSLTLEAQLEDERRKAQRKRRRERVRRLYE